MSYRRSLFVSFAVLALSAGTSLAQEKKPAPPEPDPSGTGAGIGGAQPP